jgi:predicted NAD-dependent protein-ADP-ribosyltransferase YbiA (DUF1768 family)/polyhydroxyalkanoate synthesis regulator phasin
MMLGESETATGQSSGKLMEIVETAKGWVTRTGKPVYKYTKKNLDRLITKLRKPGVLNKLNKYEGTAKIIFEDTLTEAELKAKRRDLKKELKTKTQTFEEAKAKLKKGSDVATLKVHNTLKEEIADLQTELDDVEKILKDRTDNSTLINLMVVAVGVDRDNEPLWEVTLEELSSGEIVVRQRITNSFVDQARMLQIRKILERGEKDRRPEFERFYVEGKDPNGNTVRYHLGEITKLGRIERYGPGNYTQRHKLFDAYEDFLYGVGTLTQLGFRIDNFEELQDSKVIFGRNITYGQARSTEFKRLGEILKFLSSSESRALIAVNTLLNTKGRDLKNNEMHSLVMEALDLFKSNGLQRLQDIPSTKESYAKYQEVRAQNLTTLSMPDIIDALLGSIFDPYVDTEAVENFQTVDSSSTINIFWGTKENAQLSNLAPRPFKFKGKQYQSVEHAYQTLKSGTFDARVYSAKGWQRGGLAARGSKTDHSLTESLMRQLIKASFEANPIAKEALRQTGNAKLTHNQARGFWKTKFPALLMEYRASIKEKTIAPSSEDKVQFDGELRYTYEGYTLRRNYHSGKFSATTEYYVITDSEDNIVAHLPSTVIRDSTVGLEDPDTETRVDTAALKAKMAKALLAEDSTNELVNDAADMWRLLSLSGIHDQTYAEAAKQTMLDNERISRVESSKSDVTEMFLDDPHTAEDPNKDFDDGAYFYSDAQFGNREEWVNESTPFGDNYHRQQRGYTAVIANRGRKNTKVDNFQSTHNFVKPGVQVSDHTTGWGKKNITKIVEDILARLDIKERVVMFDEDSIASVRVALERVVNRKATTDAKKATQAAANDYLAFVRKIEKEIAQHEGPSGRIYIPQTRTGEKIVTNSSDRLVMIYLPKESDTAQRGWRLAHELGHLVQFVYADQLDPATRKEFMRSFSYSATPREQEEAFANYMAAQLALENPELLSKTGPTSQTGMEKYLGDLLKKLNLVYLWARKNFGAIVKYAQFGAKSAPLTWGSSDIVPGFIEVKRILTFQGFVDGLHTYIDVKRGKAQARPKTNFGRQVFKELEEASAGPYINNTRALSKDFGGSAAAIGAPWYQSYLEDFKNFGTRFKANKLDTVKTVAFTADGELTAMGLIDVARKFWVAPYSGGNPATIDRLIDIKGAPFFTELDDIFNSLPKLLRKPWEQILLGSLKNGTTESARHRERISLLLLEQTPMEEIRNTESAEVVASVERIRNYLRKMYDWYTQDMGLTLGDMGYEYFPLMISKFKVEKNLQAFIDILVSVGGFNPRNARRFADQLLRDHNGGLTTGFNEEVNADFEFFGPGNQRKLSRNTESWTPELRIALARANFYENDIGTVLTGYTDMLVRRAVWETEFSLAPEQITIEVAARFHRLGLNPHSPIARLQYRIANARHRHEINQTQYERVVNDILPAYAGQLGLRTHPSMRKIGAMMVVYQNLRVLALAVTAQTVDLATAMTRSDLEALQVASREMFQEVTRKEAIEMLRVIGALRHGVTEHILNDQALNTFTTGVAKSINDIFFRINLMEGWTNNMRAFALIAGRDFIKRHARKAASGDALSQKYMEELGANIQEINNWDGHTMASDHIKAVLNRFIDESMIRPSAPIRPVYMSDPGYMMFSHLKGFMYGFHKTFGAPALKEASVNNNLLPLIRLFMFTLPMAAVGWEWRRLITGTEHPRPKGVGYVMELVERSGMPGPFQMYLDGEQAQAYGNPWIAGAGGPTVSQVFEFMQKDLGKTIPRAIPIVSQFPALREKMEF